MLNQDAADLVAIALQQGEETGRKAAGADRRVEHAGKALAGRRVAGMPLYDHRATGCEGGCAVAAARGKGEGEVARGKHRYRPQWQQHAPNVGSRQRLSLGQRGINDGLNIGALAQQGRESAQLSRGAPQLACQARDAKCSLLVGGRYEQICVALYLFSDCVQKICQNAGGKKARLREGVRRRAQGSVDFCVSSAAKARLAWLARARIDAEKGLAAGRAPFARDAIAAAQGHRPCSFSGSLECGAASAFRPASSTVRIRSLS